MFVGLAWWVGCIRGKSESGGAAVHGVGFGSAFVLPTNLHFTWGLVYFLIPTTTFRLLLGRILGQNVAPSRPGAAVQRRRRDRGRENQHQGVRQWQRTWPYRLDRRGEETPQTSDVNNHLPCPLLLLHTYDPYSSRPSLKTDWRLVPILGACYAISAIDRINVRFPPPPCDPSLTTC